MGSLDIFGIRRRKIANKFALIEAHLEDIERLIEENKAAILQNGRLNNTAFLKIQAHYEACCQQLEELQKELGQDLSRKSLPRFLYCWRRMQAIETVILDIKEELLDAQKTGKTKSGKKLAPEGIITVLTLINLTLSIEDHIKENLKEIVHIISNGEYDHSSSTGHQSGQAHRVHHQPNQAHQTHRMHHQPNQAHQTHHQPGQTHRMHHQPSQAHQIHHQSSQAHSTHH